MTNAELEKALDVFTVLETGDIELARAVASPTFTNRESAVAPPATAIPGPAGLLASSAWMRSAFDDLHFEIIESSYDSGVAWIRLRMQGRQNRPFVRYADGKPDQVLPATGKRIDFEQIHVLHLDDRGVTTHEAVRDDMTMLDQLGVFPPTPAIMIAMVRDKVTGRARRAADAVTRVAADAAAQA